MLISRSTWLVYKDKDVTKMHIDRGRGALKFMIRVDLTYSESVA
jgi:hypothetical protein